MLAGVVGWTLPLAASAQEAPPLPPPVEHTKNVSPVEAPPLPAGYMNLPPGAVLEPAPSSGRFHVLPQSWRDSISRRFGGGPTTVVPGHIIESQNVVAGTGLPPHGGPILPVSSPAPQEMAMPGGLGGDAPPLPETYTNLPPDMIGEPAPSSGRFHLLPQSWRDSISRRFGGSPSPAPYPIIDTPSVAPSTPPPPAPASPVQPVSLPAPAPQAAPLGQPGFSGSYDNIPSPVQIMPRAPDTWSSPPEPPVTGQTPLPLRDPFYAWTKEAVSAPSPLPPPPAPPYPARFHILPECIREPLGKCLNGCGMACYADRDTPGCGSWRQEFLFVFGSCHYFFGEKCTPDF